VGGPRRVRIALACAVLTAAAACAGPWLRPAPPPRTDRAPAPAPAAGAVRPGVRVAGRPVGGLAPADAERRLRDLAASWAREPQDARVDPETRGLVPGVDGRRLDVPATLRRVLRAPAGAEVEPVVVPLAPTVRLEDLPPAPVYRGPRTRRAVTFLINVAWGDRYLPAMLETLRIYRAAATFCLVGRWAEEHPDLVRQIVDAAGAGGAAIGLCNHGYRDHGWAALGRAEALRSIRAADQAIARLTGSAPRYFSPHRGEFNPEVLAAARESGHELVLWSLDTVDWRPGTTAGQVLARVAGRVRPGDIVLLHPTAASVQALPGLIEAVRAKGLALVPLDVLLSARRGPWDP
jgi:peptidoglycan/xylan/chitin deacetylase (PgdA/CDA1 family)